MKVARFSRLRPALSMEDVFGNVSGGPSGTVPTSNGSNSLSFGSNVAKLFVNGLPVMGPDINIANGSNTTWTIDQGPGGSTPSNTIRVHATGGGSLSYGSNSNAVSSANAPGAATEVSRADHVHLGVTSLSHSSNTFSGPVILTASGTLGITSPTPGTYDLSATGGTGGGGGGSSSAPDPVFDAFGTPDTAFEFGTSSLTGLTAMGTADTEAAHTTVAGHLLLGDDDSTQVGRYAAVSAPATMIVKLTDFVAYENYQYVGCFVGVATPGAFNWLGVLGGASPSLVMRSFTSPGDGSPGAIAITRVPTDSVGFTPWYFGIRAASTTDVSFYVSRSGIVWQPVLLSRNPSLTVGSMGVSLGNYAGGSQPRAQGAYDFIRIWNSAKTFPSFD